MANFKIQKGFTLIELMIAIAIISILASIAIPQYQAYTRNARATAAMAEIRPYQTAVAICAQAREIADCTPGNGGVPNVFGSLTSAREVAGAMEFTVTPGGPFGAQTLIFTSDATGVNWTLVCNNGGDTGANNLCATDAVTNF
jgi:prepilin-type N-terminal cleavage/methylation domain-containing protein